MMAPRRMLSIVLAFLAITETSTSSPNRWRRCRNEPTLCNGQVTRTGLKAVYGCNTGFRLAVTTDCLRGRSWTPRVTCEEILCEDDPVKANGSLDSAIDSRSVGAEYNLKCDAGFKGMGKVVCNECGKWDVSEVECTECIFLTNTRAKFNLNTISSLTETQCTERCNSESTCSVSLSGQFCELFPLPIIAASKQPTLQDCSDACDANDACKILNFTPFQQCLLFNTDDVVSLTLDSEANYTILSKNCQF